VVALGVQLIKHEENKVHSEWSHVSFPELIADQVRTLTAVLNDACASLDTEDAKHHQQAKWDLWHALKARGRRPKVRPLRKTA